MGWCWERSVGRRDGDGVAEGFESSHESAGFVGGVVALVEVVGAKVVVVDVVRENVPDGHDDGLGDGDGGAFLAGATGESPELSVEVG